MILKSYLWISIIISIIIYINIYCLSINTFTFFLFVSDAQNAFKVRLSIKTALGDNAVSKVFSHIVPN